MRGKIRNTNIEIRNKILMVGRDLPYSLFNLDASR